MADKNPLTPEEVTELFSEIDASGVLDPTLAKKRTERMREKEAAAKRGDKAALAQLRSEDRASQAKHIDPLSEDDPSGSQVSHTITKTAMAVVIGILVLIVGMQIGYGVMRRLKHRQPVRERFGRYRFDGAEGRPRVGQRLYAVPARLYRR